MNEEFIQSPEVSATPQTDFQSINYQNGSLPLEGEGMGGGTPLENWNPKKHMTVTPAKIAANRQNAQSSTGARTDKGKIIVSKNAVTHGLTGAFVLIKGENPEAYRRYLAMYLYELAPCGMQEHQLAVNIVQNSWRINRIGILSDLAIVNASSREAMEAELARLSLYGRRIRRDIAEDIRELERLQANRMAGKRFVVSEKAMENCTKNLPPPDLAYLEELPYDAYEGRKRMEHRLDVARAAFDYKCEACSKVIPPDEIVRIKGYDKPVQPKREEAQQDGASQSCYWDPNPEYWKGTADKDLPEEIRDEVIRRRGKQAEPSPEEQALADAIIEAHHARIEAEINGKARYRTSGANARNSHPEPVSPDLGLFLQNTPAAGQTHMQASPNPPFRMAKTVPGPLQVPETS